MPGGGLVLKGPADHGHVLTDEYMFIQVYVYVYFLIDLFLLTFIYMQFSVPTHLDVECGLVIAV